MVLFCQPCTIRACFFGMRLCVCFVGTHFFAHPPPSFVDSEDTGFGHSLVRAVLSVYIFGMFFLSPSFPFPSLRKNCIVVFSFFFFFFSAIGNGGWGEGFRKEKSIPFFLGNKRREKKIGRGKKRENKQNAKEIMFTLGQLPAGQ
jgi:hypothetical protein